MRIGHGYDVHRLVQDMSLILGGVKIDHEKGLLGHSDADVLIHSIIDALLGAMGKGDIGQKFPDNDTKYSNINSLLLLDEVVIMLKQNMYDIVNIDSTLILEEPKLSKYIPDMKEKISGVCGIDIDQINIKATTEEKLGFTGSCQGVAAHSVCLIKKTTGLL